MSEGHILFNSFFRPAAHAPSFLTFSFSPLSSFIMPRRSILFLAGDLAQLQLPVGMKDLNLYGCMKLTGTAQLRE